MSEKGKGRVETKKQMLHSTTSELRLWLIQELSVTDVSAGWFVDMAIEELKQRKAIIVDEEVNEE